MTERSWERTRWPFRLARMMPPVLLEQPWAFFVKLACIISGVTTFLGPAPGSIQTTLPQPVVTMWSVTLILGATVGLVGLIWPRYRRLEITGLIWLGTAALVYAVTIFLRFGFPGIVAGGLVLAFGLAALVRALAVYVTFEIAREIIKQ